MFLLLVFKVKTSPARNTFFLVDFPLLEGKKHPDGFQKKFIFILKMQEKPCYFSHYRILCFKNMMQNHNK